MSLKYEKPNPALMRELEFVASDAVDLLRVLKTANVLPEDFPLDEVKSIASTLQALHRGTDEGCREPLDYCRRRLAEIGQQHIKPEDATNSSEVDDEPPALTRGMALDQAFGRLFSSINYAQAEYLAKPVKLRPATMSNV